jgi:hypothetical protein
MGQGVTSPHRADVHVLALLAPYGALGFWKAIEKVFPGTSDRAPVWIELSDQN